MLALAAAAGAAGGPQKGALAGFVLGLMYDLARRHAARLVVDRHGPRRVRRRLRACRSRSIPQWWLAALFTGLGAAVGELAVPVDPGVHRRGARVRPRFGIVVAVVAAARDGAQPAARARSDAGACASSGPEWKAIRGRPMMQSRRARPHRGAATEPDWSPWLLTSAPRASASSALVATLLFGAARDPAVVPADRAGRVAPGDGRRAQDQDGPRWSPSGAASSTPTAASSPTTSGC